MEDPEKLIGRRIAFKCQTCKSFIEFGLVSINKQYKSYRRSWSYIGPYNLVVYDVDSIWPDHKFQMDNITIDELLKKGFYNNNGAEYKLI